MKCFYFNSPPNFRLVFNVRFYVEVRMEGSSKSSIRCIFKSDCNKSSPLQYADTICVVKSYGLIRELFISVSIFCSHILVGKIE